MANNRRAAGWSWAVVSAGLLTVGAALPLPAGAQDKTYDLRLDSKPVAGPKSELRETSTNLSEATSKLNKTDNSVGKIFNDPQLYDNLAAASAELRTFLTEFRKNPKKYLTVKLSFF